MERKTRITLIFFFAAIVVLVTFFGGALFRLVREAQEADEARFVQLFPSGAELIALLPAGVSGPFTQDLVELDEMPGRELVIGYALRDREAVLPRVRAFRKFEDSWSLVSEFRFLVDPYTYANAAEWGKLSGVPSFERKDIDGNGREEIFTRLDIGSQFYRATGIVVWNGEDLVWLPLYDREGKLILPLFLEGGTPTEARRLFAEDASGGGGLDIIAAHGLVDPQTGVQRWQYEIFVERDGAYWFDASLSEAYTAVGRPPA
ncbi:MAG: hypothetical protein Q8P82_00030 [bacterium]|nr:hypothetical protein [bacterium]